LIRRFVDADAEFLYVPTDQVFSVAAEAGATPYDIPGADPFSHDGELCSFDAVHTRVQADRAGPANLGADRPWR
jgi:hypothetical protein